MLAALAIFWMLVAAPVSAHASADLGPPELPTTVGVQLELVGLSRIDPASEGFPTFTSELLLVARWHDPRLALPADDPRRDDAEPRRYFGHAATERVEAIWSPDLAIENEEGPRTIEHREIEITADGHVRYVERLSVTAHAEVDLRRFPFDTQRLELRIAPFTWDVEHVRLELTDGRVDFDAEHTNLEWTLLGVEGQVHTEDRLRLDKPVSTLEAHVVVKRKAGFYLYKLLLPLILIVIFTWSAFWMRREASAGRMQRTFIALLTVVAFHHIVAGHLPRISYLTFVDAVVYAAFLSVGATLLQVVRIHNADQAGDEERARRLERLGRWAHPLGFGGTIVVLWLLFNLL